MRLKKRASGQARKVHPRMLPIVTAALAGILAGGCYQPPANLDLQEPTWETIEAGPRADLDTFLASYPTRVAAEVRVGQTLDVSAMRRLVLTRHPAVLSAQAAVAKAQARRGAAGAWPNPEIDSRALWDDAGDVGVEGALVFALPIGGRLGAARREADIGIELARADLEAAWKGALLELDEALAHVASAQTRLALHENLAERSAQYADLIRERQGTSMADPLDVSLVLADAAQDHRDLIHSRNELHYRESRLRLLLALQPGTDLGAIPFQPQRRVTENREHLTAAARARRDSWRRAHLMLQQAEWAAAHASRERIPDLNLGPAIERAGSETSVGVAAGISVPLFSSGGAAFREALARRDAAQVTLQAEARAALTEIDVLLSRVEALEAELGAVSGEAAEAVALAFELAEARYETAQIDVLHLLSAHRAYADLKLEILDLELAHREALLELEAAVGWPPQTVITSDAQEARP